MRMEGQSPEVAKKLYKSFVKNMLKRAKKAADCGDRKKALKYLADALHPLMDSSSPMHIDEEGNPRQWSLSLKDAPGHSPNDSIGFEKTSDITKEIYRNQDFILNEAYDRFFGK